MCIRDSSTIQWGLAVDMSKIGTPTAHAIACLAGITGNIDNPGGNILIDPVSYTHLDVYKRQTLNRSSAR